MNVLAVILARAGSKGLRDKCVRPLLGRPLIDYSFDHVLCSARIDETVLTTDSVEAADLASARGIRVVERPATLATDTAPVDAVVRHALAQVENDGSVFDVLLIVYGNIPVRASGILDRAVDHLISTGADSVRSVAAIGKHHPDWLHALDGDRMIQFRKNSIHRRQDLDSLYYHDGAAVAVTRESLLAAAEHPEDPHAFFGLDRRAIVQMPEDTVDVDGIIDLYVAEAILRDRHDAKCHEVTLCPDGAPYIIAEAGVNHNGDEGAALSMVDAAAESGADAVKFQMFTTAALVTATAPAADYQTLRTDHARQRDMLEALELSDTSFGRIAARCAERGIAFMATPFTVPDLDRLLTLGTAAIKIASTDIVDVALLDAACRANRPIILSTGAADEAEIAAAVAQVDQGGGRDRLVLLHCVSAYPTPMADANLAAIRTLRVRFSTTVGFSDHTTSTLTGALAVAAGARVLEKHFTLDASAVGPDHVVSLEPAALAEYVRLARGARDALGDGRLGVQRIEADVRRVARKTIVAACAIPADGLLSHENLTTKRAGTGLAPDQMDRLLGMHATVSIEPETPISWEMVQ